MECNMKTRLVTNPSDAAKGRQQFFQNLMPEFRQIPTASRATFLSCFPKPLVRFRSRLKGLRLLQRVQLSFASIVYLMCLCISVTAAASNSSEIAANSTHKILNENLALFSRNSISSESASSSSEIYDPFLLFTHAVNATSLETVPPIANTSAVVTSTESRCADSADCPVALPLSAAGSSVEAASYVPHVLPQWSKVMERRNHPSFDSSESNSIDDASAQDQSVTPAVNWRIFKYVNHPDELSNLTALNGTSGEYGEPSSLEMYKIHQSNMTFSEEETFFNKSLSSTERSLIRNSFFGNETTNSTLEDTSGSLNETDRPRRSPFRPHWKNEKLFTHREPLYGLASVPAPNLHPPPPGMAVMQPLMGPPKPFSTFQQQQPNRMQGDNPAHAPSIRLPSFHHPFAKPKPIKVRHHHHGRQNHHKRRPPHHHGKPPRGRGRPNGNGPVPAVMPAPRPIPVPRPIPIPVPGPRPSGPITASSGGPQPMPMHHHHPPHAAPLRSLGNGGPPPHGGPHFGGPPPGGDLPPPIQYTYPKHAENIQDILSYFNTDNEISPAPGRPSNDAFSNELKEIQGSLLKDIREFAQRPSLLSDGDKRPSGRINDNPQPIKSSSFPVPKPSMTSLIEEDDEDYLEPKPKPVRQLVREEDRDRRNRNRERERERDRDRTPSDDYQDRLPDYEETRYTTSKKPQRNRKPSTSTYDEEERDRYRPLEEEEEEPLNDDEDLPIRRPSTTTRVRDRERTKDRETDDYYDNVRRPSNPKVEREQPKYYSPSGKYPVDEYESEEERRSRFRPSRNYDKFVKDSRDRHRERMREQYASDTKYSRPSKSKSKGKRQNYRIRHEASSNQDRFRQNGNQHLRHKTLDTTPNPVKKPPTAMDVAYYQQRNRPVVIKRPYQQYQPVDIRQVERQRQKQDEYWNTVTTIDVKNQQKHRPHHKLRSSGSITKPKSVQNHYHYYGVPPGGQESPPTRFNTPPQLVTSNSSPEEEDILEIHTATPRGEAVANSSPGYSTVPSSNQLDYDHDRKARLQKMYMDYLQRKLESQAEAQAEAMLSSSSRPFIPSMPVAAPPYPQPPRPSRKPMRMKIHIYPNEQVQVVDGNNQNVYKSALAPPSSYIPSSVPRPSHYSPVPTSAYTNNQYYNPRPTPGYQKTVVHHHHSGVPGVPPYTTYNTNTAQHRSSSVGAPPVATSVLHPIIPAQPGRPIAGPNDKGNVVLHLHVHRRNGEAPGSPGGMMMAGSENIMSTVKPLTYEEIYATAGPEDQANIQDMLPSPSSPHESRRKSSSSLGETGRKLAEAVDTDKSISMELPIHQDKVDHVLSTLFKMRD